MQTHKQMYWVGALSKNKSPISLGRTELLPRQLLKSLYSEDGAAAAAM